MLITDRRRTRGRDLVEIVARAVRGGVRLVQVREPDLPDDELRDLVQRIRGKVPDETVLVVNGSVRVARTLRIGLHLPARAPAGGRPRLAGPYGRSAHDDQELFTALEDGVDYVVLGTIFSTPSKPGWKPAGLALIERAGRQVGRLPIYAIGGMSVSRVPAVIHAGAYGIAVSGAILSAGDPERVAQALCLALGVARSASAAY